MIPDWRVPKTPQQGESERAQSLPPNPSGAVKETAHVMGTLLCNKQTSSMHKVHEDHHQQVMLKRQPFCDDIAFLLVHLQWSKTDVSAFKLPSVCGSDCKEADSLFLPSPKPKVIFKGNCCDPVFLKRVATKKQNKMPPEISTI